MTNYYYYHKNEWKYWLENISIRFAESIFVITWLICAHLLFKNICVTVKANFIKILLYHKQCKCCNECAKFKTNMTFAYNCICSFSIRQMLTKNILVCSFSFFFSFHFSVFSASLTFIQSEKKSSWISFFLIKIWYTEIRDRFSLRKKFISFYCFPRDKVVQIKINSKN